MCWEVRSGEGAVIGQGQERRPLVTPGFIILGAKMTTNMTYDLARTFGPRLFSPTCTEMKPKLNLKEKSWPCSSVPPRAGCVLRGVASY